VFSEPPETPQVDLCAFGSRILFVSRMRRGWRKCLIGSMQAMTARARALSAHGFNSLLFQGVNQICEQCISVQDEVRCEAAPEVPARSLEDALAAHVLLPLIGTMVTIPITFDGKSRAIGLP